MAVRAFLALAFALCALPVASAQTAQGMGFEIEPFDGPLPPLVEVTRNWTLRMACEPVPQVQPGSTVYLTIEKLPAWAKAKLEPSVVEPEDCFGERVVRGVLKAHVTAEAPAFTAEQLEIVVGQQGQLGSGNETSKTAMPLSADFFSIIDVQIEDSIAEAKPGGSHGFPVKLTNLGNANTIVTITLVSIGEGLRAEAIAPIVLQSKQAGGTEISRELEIVLHAAEGAGYLNEVGVANFLIRSRYALDDIEGDTSSISLLLTTRGLDTPGPSSSSLALALAFALALVAISSQRRALRP